MQSLPLLKRNTLATHQRCSSQVRGMASLKLACAFKRGLVSGRQAGEAMAQGEAAVATLIAPLLYRGDMASKVPEFDAGQSLVLPPSVYDELAPFVRELQEQGLIGDEDWKGATASTAADVLIELAHIGTQRIVEEAQKMVPNCAVDFTPYYLIPQALACIAPTMGLGMIESKSGVGQTLVTMQENSPFIAIPTPDTKEEKSAICCLIDAINQKSCNWMMVPPDQAVEVLDPTLSELVADMKVALRGQRLTSATLPASMRDAVEDWYGEIPADPDDADAMLESLSEAVEAAETLEKWKIEDGRLDAWLGSAVGTNVSLVQRLYDFWKALPKTDLRVEREPIGDSISGSDLFLMWESDWNCHQGTIQGMAEYYDPTEVFSIRKKVGRKKAKSDESRCPLVDSFRAAVMATTVATATTRIIIDACAD